MTERKKSCIYYDENGFTAARTAPFEIGATFHGSDITYEKLETLEVLPVSGTITKIVHHLPAPDGAHHPGLGDKLTLTFEGISVEALNDAKPEWFDWDVTEEGQASLIAFLESLGVSVEIQLEPYNQILGTDDQDMLVGTSDRDDIQGGDGEDVIFGGDNNDTIGGGLGADVIYGGGGDDHIYSDPHEAGKGGDFIYAQDGDDEVWIDMVPEEGSGLPNEDFTSVSGGAGNDSITVNGGKTVVDGGEGDDSLSFRSGEHTVWGGDGADEFHFTGGFESGSSVLVKDFDISEDKIGAMLFETFQEHAKQVGDNVVWTQDDGINSVTFANMKIADFSSELFLGDG